MVAQAAVKEVEAWQNGVASLSYVAAGQGSDRTNSFLDVAAVAGGGGGDVVDDDDAVRPDLERSCKCARVRGQWTCSCAPIANRRTKGRHCLLDDARDDESHPGSRSKNHAV